MLLFEVLVRQSVLKPGGDQKFPSKRAIKQALGGLWVE